MKKQEKAQFFSILIGALVLVYFLAYEPSMPFFSFGGFFTYLLIYLGTVFVFCLTFYALPSSIQGLMIGWDKEQEEPRTEGNITRIDDRQNKI